MPRTLYLKDYEEMLAIPIEKFSELDPLSEPVDQAIMCLGWMLSLDYYKVGGVRAIENGDLICISPELTRTWRWKLSGIGSEFIHL